MNANTRTLIASCALLLGAGGGFSTAFAAESVQATVNGGTLSIASANSNSQISFSQDSSGVLAALGIGSFYTGTDATNPTRSVRVILPATTPAR